MGDAILCRKDAWDCQVCVTQAAGSMVYQKLKGQIAETTNIYNGQKCTLVSQCIDNLHALIELVQGRS